MTYSDHRQLREKMGQAIAGMFYLSESESALELLPADPALMTQDDVAQSIEGDATAIDADRFLQSIRDSIDPGDAGLAQYLQQWEALFALLQEHTADTCVYRHGSGPVVIDIVSIIRAEAIIIRTQAVET